MEIQEIYTRALDWFDENLPEREQEQLRQLCSGAMAECRALLRPGVTPENTEPLFQQAAGMLAAAMLMEVQTPEVKSFQAGKLSITTDGGKRAEALRCCGKKLLAPWSNDGFAFVGVQA